MKRIFISIPYTHPDPAVVEERVKAAESYFMELLHRGDCPVSPVVVGHNFVTKYGANCSFEFWDKFCMEQLATCSELHILTLDGWDTSTGVAKENDMAQYFFGIPVRMIEPK